MIEEHEVEERLRGGCPAPAAGWRGALRRELLSYPPPPSRPARLWLLVAGSAGLGSMLLILAALAA